MADGFETLHDFKSSRWLKPLVRPLEGKWPKSGGFPACIPLEDEDGNPLLDSNGQVICQAGTGPNSVVQYNIPGLIFAPIISGIPTNGQTLDVSTGTWAMYPILFTYQWTRDGVDIAGATSQAYTLTGDDIGHEIDALVYATNNVGTSAPAYARPVGPIPDVLTISGSPVTIAIYNTMYAGFTVSAAGGWAPYTFNVIQDNFPTDVTMDGQTGVVSGFITSVTSPVAIIIQVTDRYGQTANLPPFPIEITQITNDRLDFSVTANSMYYTLGVI